jgi:transcriptional regulator with XRE-family HTH domain
MKEKRLSSAALLARLRQTAGNERVHRGTLSGVLNNRYRGTPSVVFVRGLAQALETTTDYLLGCPTSHSLARWPFSVAMGWPTRNSC